MQRDQDRIRLGTWLETHADTLPPLPRLGKTVAREVEHGQTVRYQELVFRDDNGESKVLPGEVVNLEVGDTRWRGAAIAGWDARRDSASFRCISTTQSLSYELFRVEAPAEEAPVERFETLAIAREGCIWE